MSLGSGCQAVAIVAVLVLAPTFAPSSFAQPVSRGLIAYYPFAGNAQDGSGNANDGTVIGAALTTDRAGNADSAYAFNGINSYITIPDSATLSSPTTDLTIAACIRPTGWSLVGEPFGPLLMKSASAGNAFQYRLGIGSAGVISHYNDWLTGGSGAFTFDFDGWYHVATVYDGAAVGFYVDGNLVDTLSLAVTMVSDGRPLEIGRDVPGIIEVFQGTIDEVSLHDVALTPIEIGVLADACLGATTTTSSSTTTTSTASSSITVSSTSTTTSTTTSTSFTTTTVGPEPAMLLPGRKLLVKQKKTGAQRLQMLAKDPAVMPATPCEVSGELLIEAVGVGGTVLAFPLEAGLWQPIKAKKPERGCKYRKGPVVATLQIKTGKSLKIVANADDLGVPLATDPRPVRIEVRHGEVRHCFEFGGEKGKHKADKKLLARIAGRATGCPRND